ncbi:MAG: hypothetical protein KIT11_03555 [Fimbriimonadaceae bacterium]|nr:hypothetical protein [Fimbriimonadaceae bacterium]QYK57027.1 MAG: hypothetical protein KF733_05970 [Fimbriimonadaceae bacterium]
MRSVSADSQAPFRREMTAEFDPGAVSETEFEKRRGVNRVEVRSGFLSVHVSGFDAGSDRAMAVLTALAEAGVSLDFLKLTSGGLSFLAPDAAESAIRRALEGIQAEHKVRPGLSVVLVHAVNMRDEEGLIARIVSETIATGAEIDHLGDMHDRVLMVVSAEDAEAIRARLEPEGA